MPDRRTILLLLFVCLLPRPAAPQTYAVEADLLFYGDNTEFSTPFREGETILGASGQVVLEAALNDNVTVRGGFFGLGRFGAHEFLEHAEPAIALEVSRGASRFVFGSLHTAAARHDVIGPDRDTLHGLLPPIQQETLTFSRGQEMGLQWLIDSDALEQDAWINWQRLNTANARERLDAGYRADVGVGHGLALQGEWHVVHEGGQQFDSGPVSDSQAAALGAEWARTHGAVHFTVDAHAVVTSDVPDRALPDTKTTGGGVFFRGAADRGPWRTHLIVWRSRDALKAEGDANYLARRLDGSVFRGVRDYAELGVTRHFRPAPGVHLFAAARLHRIESHYQYSYRIVGRVRIRHGF